MQTRDISFDGTRVGINYHEPGVEEILDLLFRDLQPDPSAKLIEKLDITYSKKTGEWQLKHNHKNLFKGKNLAGLATVLMGEVLFHLIRENDTALAIHAGLVSSNGISILLPGNSGSGKSSVTTWFVNQGYHYHTDELVSINLDSGLMKAFTRPLNIKTSGVNAIKTLLEPRDVTPDSLVSSTVTMIPHRLVNPEYVDQVAPLGCVIFPKYIDETESELVPLTGAEAGLEMMRSNVIARNLPSHGFKKITGLVRDIPAFRLNYRNFADLIPLVDEIELGSL